MFETVWFADKLDFIVGHAATLTYAKTKQEWWIYRQAFRIELMIFANRVTKKANLCVATLLTFLMEHFERKCESVITGIDKWFLEFAANYILAFSGAKIICVQAKVIFFPLCVSTTNL